MYEIYMYGPRSQCSKQYHSTLYIYRDPLQRDRMFDRIFQIGSHNLNQSDPSRSARSTILTNLFSNFTFGKLKALTSIGEDSYLSLYCFIAQIHTSLPFVFFSLTSFSVVVFSFFFLCLVEWLPQHHFSEANEYIAKNYSFHSKPRLILLFTLSNQRKIYSLINSKFCSHFDLSIYIV